MGMPTTCASKILGRFIPPYDATVTIQLDYTDGEVKVTAFIPADIDAVVLEVEDTRPNVPHQLQVETWRKTASTAMDEGLIVVRDKLSWEGEPDYRFALVTAMDEAKPATGETTALETTARRYVAYAVLAQTRDSETDVVARAKERLAGLRKQGVEAVRQGHRQWWSRFWTKSLVHLTSKDGIADYIENLWAMHIYVMGAGSRGEVPPKFNGGHWIHNRDVREWGAEYWHWNQQLAMWPIFASNHLELHRPYQNMYFGALPHVKKWTKETYGLDGAQIHEEFPFHGRHGRRAHWPTVSGVHPRVPTPAEYTHNNGTLSTSAEVAMQFWWYWLYTGDKAFLQDKAYPLMKEVTLFYLGYLEKDDKGRYIMWPSNAHESYLCVKNPTSDLASIRYLFPRVIQAAELLGCDVELRDRCSEALAHLAPYPIDPEGDYLMPYERQPGETVKMRNSENVRLFPVSIFPLITLDSPDYQLGLRTFRNRTHINVYGWNSDGIAAARLGIADEEVSNRLFPGRKPGDKRTYGLEWLLPDHVQRYQNYPCGLMDYYWRQPGMHPYLEGSGTLATAVNEMLLQSWDGLIRVAPALPKAWSAKFTLLAMGGFLVTAECEKGKVLYVAIESQRGGVMRLANPFGEPAVVRSGGKTVSNNEKGNVISFETEAGRTYQVVPARQPEAASDRPVLTGRQNNAPKNLPGKNTRSWIGKPDPAVQRAQNEDRRPLVKRQTKPSFHITRTSRPPLIDGKLNDVCWKDRNALGSLVILGKKRLAMDQTQVMLTYDEKALYLAAVCYDPKMDQVWAHGDDGSNNLNIFGDDSIEIYLQSLPPSYWHLAVNAKGALYKALVTDGEHDVTKRLDIQRAVGRQADAWIVEAAIPFASIGALPDKGNRWSFNFGRNHIRLEQTSTWAPLSKHAFHVPEEFGYLAFGRTPDELRPAAGYSFEGATLEEAARDSSPDQHPGQFAGDASLAPGKVGQALSLSGKGYFDISHSPAGTLTEAITVEAWIYPVAINARVIDKSTAGIAEYYNLDIYPKNHIRWSTPAGTVGTTEPIPLKAWTHLAAIYSVNDGRLCIYINGELKAERRGTACAVIPANTNPLRIGVDSTGVGNFFRGMIDEVRIYQRELSAEEIKKQAECE